MTTKKQKHYIAIILVLCLLFGLGIGFGIDRIANSTSSDRNILDSANQGNKIDHAGNTPGAEDGSDKMDDASLTISVTPSEVDTPKTDDNPNTTDVPDAPNTDVAVTTGQDTSTEDGTVTDQPATTDTAIVTDEKLPTDGNITATPAATKAPTKVATPVPTKQVAATSTPTPTPKKEAVATKTPTPTKKPTSTPTPTTKPAKVETGTPVANHGQLSVKGTQIVDKNGKAYQIQGVSTAGLQWFPQYVTKETFKTLRDEWGVNCVRLAMYTAENGYCEGGDKAKLKKTVENGVQYATELGLYVIIDWHILHDTNPNDHKDEAIKFFDEVSKKYADYNNVIYEICNEPNGSTSWSQIKSYAEDVIKTIRNNDPHAIIVVGTPTWSQEVDKAAADPITGQKDIMYTLHFYSGTHKEWLMDTYKKAIKAGLPIFVTEFGITDASGDGACDEATANKWIALLESNTTGYVIWNLANKNESSCLLKSTCKKVSGFTMDDLSQEGKWYVKLLSGGINLPTVDKDTSGGNNNGGNTDSGNSGNSDGNTDSGNSGNDNNNNSGGEVEAAKPLSFSSGIVTIKTENSWNEDGYWCYTLNNIFSESPSGKTITITFSGNCMVKGEPWGGKVTVSGNSIIITDAEQWFGMNFGVEPNSTVQSVTIK